MAKPHSPESTAAAHSVTSQAQQGRYTPSWWNLPELLLPYWILLKSRVSSQTIYGRVFLLEFVGVMAFMLAELAEILVYFHNTRTFGGLTLSGMLVMLGLSSMSFAFCKIMTGHLDEVGTFIREGKLETFYARPLSIFGQLVTSDIDLKRLGRAGISVVVLGIGLWRSGVEPTLATAGLLIVAVVSGIVIFGALFLIAGTTQFFLINAPELGNTITYATNYVSQLPTSIFPRAIQWIYLFIIPAGFIAYLPTLQLLGINHTFWMPPGAGWFAPLSALSISTLAGIFWHCGTRRYQGAGG